MKLWDKGTKATEKTDRFTVGKDRELDLRLAPYDIQGSVAHARMLEKTGLLKKGEAEDLCRELEKLLEEVKEPEFFIPEEFEDIHSFVEFRLTEKLGDTGKKIHTARSRNDQVLTDLHLYLKEEIRTIESLIRETGNVLLDLAEKHKDTGLPGYTHMQIAMPSSIGMWLSAYAELLADDLFFFRAAYDVADQNPLGSAAGYGSSFPIDRKMTTELLRFKDLKYNSVAAQLSRGKLERSVAFALASVSSTIAKLSMDVVLYTGQNFGFISFPDELTTGSSIMPHKKNPDVFELTRAKCNKIQALPVEIQSITTNLPSGYHRDFQLLKESLFNGIDDFKDCLEVILYALPRIRVSENILKDEKYRYLYSVEAVGALVQEGKTFRDAYREVGEAIEKGMYQSPEGVSYTHIGSIDNLCLDLIRKKLKII